jgi:ribosomal protein S18 acetylase RimI-like enzyme
MDINYEILRSADRDQVVSLYKQAGWWDSSKDSDTSFIDKMIEKTHIFAAAFDGKKMVGMGRAISEGVTDAYIQDVTVLKEYRSRGIGSELIKMIVSKLREQKIGWIGLICEPGAEKFYNDLGFEIMKGYTPYIYKRKENEVE